MKENDLESTNTNLEDYFNQLLVDFERQITDSVFCFIQNDRQQMKEYLDVIANTGDLQKVNRQLAQTIERRYGLKGEGEMDKENNPQSTLIQSYTKLCRK